MHNIFVAFKKKNAGFEKHLMSWVMSFFLFLTKSRLGALTRAGGKSQKHEKIDNFNSLITWHLHLSVLVL